ncbi:hypothetical protein BGZ98_000165 [Dissophora globulifera]|nr:hypothetical protein BGZ98_000165 [Dissophora globulifera]
MSQLDPRSDSRDLHPAVKRQTDLHDINTPNHGADALQPSYQPNAAPNARAITTTATDSRASKMGGPNVAHSQAAPAATSTSTSASPSRRASVILAKAEEAASTVVAAARRLVLDEEDDEEGGIPTASATQACDHHGLEFKQRHLAGNRTRQSPVTPATPTSSIVPTTVGAPALRPVDSVITTSTILNTAPVPTATSVTTITPVTTMPVASSSVVTSSGAPILTTPRVETVYATSNPNVPSDTAAGVNNAIPGTIGSGLESTGVNAYVPQPRTRTSEGSVTAHDIASKLDNNDVSTTAVGPAAATNVHSSSLNPQPSKEVLAAKGNPSSTLNSHNDKPFDPYQNEKGPERIAGGIDKGFASPPPSNTSAMNTMYVTAHGKDSARSQAMGVDAPAVSHVLGSPNTRSGMGVDVPRLVGEPSQAKDLNSKGGLNVDTRNSRDQPFDDTNPVQVPHRDYDPTWENGDSVPPSSIQTSRDNTQVLHGNIHHSTQNSLPEAQAAISQNPYEAYMSHPRDSAPSGLNVDHPVIPTSTLAGSGSTDNTNHGRPEGIHNSGINVDKPGAHQNSRSGMGVDGSTTATHHLAPAGDPLVPSSHNDKNDTAAIAAAGVKKEHGTTAHTTHPSTDEHEGIIDKFKDVFRHKSVSKPAESTGTNDEYVHKGTPANVPATGLGIGTATSETGAIAESIPATSVAATTVVPILSTTLADHQGTTNIAATPAAPHSPIVTRGFTPMAITPSTSTLRSMPVGPVASMPVVSSDELRSEERPPQDRSVAAGAETSSTAHVEGQPVVEAKHRRSFLDRLFGRHRSNKGKHRT